MTLGKVRDLLVVWFGCSLPDYRTPDMPRSKVRFPVESTSDGPEFAGLIKRTGIVAPALIATENALRFFEGADDGQRAPSAHRRRYHQGTSLP